MNTSAFPDIAPIASLIGSPARAAMLSELLGGRALTATELATRASVAPSTASEHLARLVQGQLVVLEAQGRHRYYRLAGLEVAHLLETLGMHAQPVPDANRDDHRMPSGIRFARTCYDHLAGYLGVAVRDALIERRMLVEAGGEHQVTPTGQTWFAAFGIDLDTTRQARRSFARRCLDWSERRPHLAGALGATLLECMETRGWLVRMPSERTVILTPTGRDGLRHDLGIELPPS